MGVANGNDVLAEVVRAIETRALRQVCPKLSDEPKIKIVPTGVAAGTPSGETWIVIQLTDM